MAAEVHFPIPERTGDAAAFTAAGAGAGCCGVAWATRRTGKREIHSQGRTIATRDNDIDAARFPYESKRKQGACRMKDAGRWNGRQLRKDRFFQSVAAVVWMGETK